MIPVVLAATLLAASPDRGRDLPAPHRHAEVFNGLAGGFVLTGIGLHIGGVVAMQASGKREPGLVLMSTGTMMNAFALVPTGLGGAAAGRALAYDDRTPPAWKNPRLGWPLFGIGLAAFVASRVAPMACFTTECALLTSEIGYFAGITAMIVGLHAASVWHGHRSARRATFTPTLGGLAVSGRF